MKNRTLLLSLITAIAVLCVPLAAQASPPAQPGGNWTQVESCQTYEGYTYCLYYYYETDCTGWDTTFNWGDMWTDDPNNTAIIHEFGTAESGTWDQPGVLESFNFDNYFGWVDTGVPGLQLLQEIAFTINEPAACEPNANKPASNGCPVTPRYFMYTLQDENQPAGWQPYCYVISNNGFPSAARQAGACSVPGSGYTFKATSAPYAGWVSTDCYGNATYGWPAWDPAWYHH